MLPLQAPEESEEPWNLSLGTVQVAANTIQQILNSWAGHRHSMELGKIRTLMETSLYPVLNPFKSILIYSYHFLMN